MERLDFRLPPFWRHTWVSEAARRVWEPRLFDIQQALRVLELRSVAAGLRRCGLLSVQDWNLAHIEKQAIKLGLIVRSLPNPPVDIQEGVTNEPASWVVASLGEPDSRLFEEQWAAGDQRELGRLLGYPSCCVDFHHKYAVEEGWQDLTWPMISNATAPPNRLHRCAAPRNEHIA